MSQPTTVLYIACSLDGKIARLDGSLDWLFAVAGDEDNGYQAFYDQVGAVIMGRKTYDEVLQLSETYPYADIPSYIYSRTQRTSETVTYTDEPLDQLLDRITPTIEGNVWLIGGGELIQEALRLKRIRSIELAIVPVILGTGIPLFPEGTNETNLRLIASRHSGQFLMATYEVLT